MEPTFNHNPIESSPPATGISAPVQPTAAVPINYVSPGAYGSLPNHIATASMICGVLFIVIALAALAVSPRSFGPAAESAVGVSLFLLPVLALILGYVGLQKTKENRYRGRPAATFGTSAGGLGILFCIFLFLTPSIGVSREIPNRIKCAANLKQIGMAMQLYANENKGLYPARFEDLMLIEETTAETFICPSSNDNTAPGASTKGQAANLATPGHCSYIYLAKGMTAPAPAKFILAYEPPPNHQKQGFNALFGDGHVEFLSGSAAQKILAELQSGQNPPPSCK